MCLTISHKEKGPLESQDSDGWLMSKMIWRIWVRGWRKIATERGAWKLILKEARVLDEP